ncbi:hypothetical protein [Streptomyces ureilyticus]|uniref:Uncharacterized protein n=1 Tax=Streptomyces ureilyticus TaxID=1775131 RepID=A0ABX0DFD4_9ACTN|nr:hypothetical protein [Streptomyces ureilyticus]NGO40601.1 hypothetical protein [Streptomyces ureilyticus]
MEFDFDCTSLPLDGTNAELRPVCDPRLCLFTIQLHEDGELAGVHGYTDNFRKADEPLEAIDAFLAEHGVRAVTDDEAVLLYGALLKQEGGVDYQLLVLAIARSQQP